MDKVRLVKGCNYHVKWQSNPGMRFVLKSVSVDGKTCVLGTSRTNKEFSAKVSDLIFITSKHNIEKADRYEEDKRKAQLKDKEKKGKICTFLQK